MVLLLHYHWDAERVIEENLKSRSALLSAVGVQQEFDEANLDSVIDSVDIGRAPLRHALKRRERSPSPGPYPHKRPRLGTTSDQILTTTGDVVQDTCGVCFDPIPLVSDTVNTISVDMHCGHRFCPSCWTSYLTSEIVDGGKLVVKCIAYKCVTILNETFIKSHASSKAYKR